MGLRQGWGRGKKAGHFISWRGKPGFSPLPSLRLSSLPPQGKMDLESGDQGSSPNFVINLWLILGLLHYLLWTSVSWVTSAFFFFFNFFFRVEVEPINSAVIVSGAGKWDSAIHTHVSILPQGFENQRVLPPSFLFPPSK